MKAFSPVFIVIKIMSNKKTFSKMSTNFKLAFLFCFVRNIKLDFKPLFCQVIFYVPILYSVHFITATIDAARLGGEYSDRHLWNRAVVKLWLDVSESNRGSRTMSREPPWRTRAVVPSPARDFLSSLRPLKMNPEKFCLSWNDFEKNIGIAFRELRESKVQKTIS